MRWAKLRSIAASAVLSPLVGLAQAVWLSPTEARELSSHLFRGTWTIETMVDAAPIVGLTQREVEEAVGRTVAFDPPTVTIGSETCRLGQASSKGVAGRAFLARYRIDANAQVPIVDRTVEVSCATSRSVGPFFASRGNLFLLWSGVLFRLGRRGT